MGKVSAGDKVICLMHYPETVSSARFVWGKKLTIGGIYTVRESFEGAISNSDVYLLLEFSGNRGFMSHLFSDKITVDNLILSYESFVIIDDRNSTFIWSESSVHIFDTKEKAEKFATKLYFKTYIKRLPELSNQQQKLIKELIINGRIIYE